MAWTVLSSELEGEEREVLSENPKLRTQDSPLLSWGGLPSMSF